MVNLEKGAVQQEMFSRGGPTYALYALSWKLFCEYYALHHLGLVHCVSSNVLHSAKQMKVSVYTKCVYMVAIAACHSTVDDVLLGSHHTFWRESATFVLHTPKRARILPLYWSSTSSPLISSCRMLNWNGSLCLWSLQQRTTCLGNTLALDALVTVWLLVFLPGLISPTFVTNQLTFWASTHPFSNSSDPVKT